MRFSTVCRLSQVVRWLIRKEDQAAYGPSEIP